MSNTQNKLCTDYEQVMLFLKDFPKDEQNEINDEIGREYLFLLFSTQAIHYLFHFANPGGRLN